MSARGADNLRRIAAPDLWPEIERRLREPSPGGPRSGRRLVILVVSSGLALALMAWALFGLRGLNDQPAVGEHPPTATARPSATLTGTDWTMAALTWQGKPVAPTADRAPSAYFHANGRLGGTFGCNSYSAKYRTEGRGTISITHLTQTLCYPGSGFAQAMMAAQRYRIDGRFLLLSGGRKTAIVFTSGAAIEPSASVRSTISLDPRDGISFAPPPTTARPSLTAAQALAAFMIVDRPSRLPADASAWLGVYRWPGPQLAWGFAYPATCEPAGNPGMHTLSPVVPVPCTRWLFLNANTGRMLVDIAQQAPD
jgi:heat shock protein HslJ